jgi:hypothetical protein
METLSRGKLFGVEPRVFGSPVWTRLELAKILPDRA